MAESKLIHIGVVGFAKHGKSTLTNIFKDMNYKEFAFASAIKYALVPMFGFTYEDLHDQYLKEIVNDFWGISPREAMQAFGEHNAEKLKEILPNLNLGNSGRLWVRNFEKCLIDNKHNIVISDIRHVEEAKAVKKAGGYIINIHNPRIKMNEEFRKHASESRINNIRYDCMIINSGTISELEEVAIKINKMLQENPLANSTYEKYIDQSHELEFIRFECA